jgi:hypothetical protein
MVKFAYQILQLIINVRTTNFLAQLRQQILDTLFTHGP